MLDARGGSDLYQVMPHQVTVLDGGDNFAAIRITDKGPARWYATCCNTPMANTWTSPKVPFATMTAVQFDDRESLGAIQTQAFRRHALGYAEKEGGGVWALYLSFARRLFVTFVSGNWRKTPFFDGDGTPRGDIRLLSDDERSHAYDAERTV